MAQASVEFDGPILRYAEVEPYGTHRRLLRLGSCVFDVDVLEALSGAEDEEGGETIAGALAEVFAGSTAQELHVVLPAHGCRSFIAPVPSGLEAADERARLEQEAAALLGPYPEDGLHLTASRARTETLETGMAVEWMHVVIVPERLRARVARLVRRALPFAACRWGVSTQGAARALIRRVDDTPPADKASEDPPWILALGQYATHVEFVAGRGRAWHSHHARVTAPADGAYFALALLDRLGIETAEVGRVLVYGPEADSEALTPLLKRAFEGTTLVECFDPMSLVDFDPDNLTADFDAGTYLSCIGILL